MFFSSVQAVASIFVFLAIGFLITKVGWIDKNNKQLLSRLVLNIAVPCTIFTNMLSAVTPDTIGEMWGYLLAPLSTVVIIYIVAYVLGKTILRVQKNRQGTFAVMSSCANTVFVGLPIISLLFGEAGTPYVMYYLMAQTTLFWSVGSMGIQRDGMGDSYTISPLGTVKKIFNLNTIIIVVALLTVALRISIPSMGMDILKKLGSMSTPLSLIFCGNSMYEVYANQGAKGLLVIPRDTFLVFLFRFIVCPVFTFFVCNLLNITGLVRSVFVIVSALPTQANTVVLTNRYGADDTFASITFFWTTLLSFAVIPILLAIMG
ncbi:AEC family transporter [Eubacteriales bacterium OttesenSCG-928-M02]|nr:AEC family transporter [Eubacteriales bacterium OttesenSCG-928-M02]